MSESSGSVQYTLGEMAHIKGKNPGSNRYDANQDEEERDSYNNLILLCPNHHTEIDKKENEGKFPSEWLLRAKAKHEETIVTLLDRKKVENIGQLKSEIASLLADNHHAWQKYGPNSLLAMSNPNSEMLYSLWTQERLTTITPNNRIIEKLLIQYRTLFPANQQLVISKFISHKASYEQWIQDEIPYQAVERFPMDFYNLIME